MSAAALLLTGLLAASAPEPTPAPLPEAEDTAEAGEPVVGDCSYDAAALAQRAEEILHFAAPGSDSMDSARRLYRRARLVGVSPLYPLRAADLASVEGDAAEEGDLLEVARERGAGALSSVERLLLARRAESRSDWSGAIDLYQEIAQEATSTGEPVAWAQERLRRLEVDREASALPQPHDPASPRSPGPEARLALADARRALARGQTAEAREKLRLALRLAPGYVEAALALGALEARESRTPEAIRAYRAALAEEPDRVETLAALSNLLWDEPDRGAKEESLILLDRAISLRPDLRPLWKLSASRWTEWGDAAKAKDRLDAYRKNATPQELEATRRLHDALAARLSAAPAAPAQTSAPEEEIEPASPAVEHWKRAQVYFRRGDEASLSAALDHLGEAERLDPSFARAPELAAAIHERRGNVERAEEALRRAVAADPFRAASHERLARLLEGRGRAAEAVAAWRAAEEAGSTEALYPLARAEEEAGHRGEAAALYERYLVESPGGIYAEQAGASLAAFAGRARLRDGILLSALAIGIVLGAAAIWRRRRVVSLSEWLRRDPARARDVRPIVGRLRHETIKHGGLLLTDAAARLREGGEGLREVCELLRERLYGETGTTGLVSSTRDDLGELSRLARQSGRRLDLNHDPLLSPIARACRVLERQSGSSVWNPASGASPEELGRVANAFERAAQLLSLTTGAALESAIDAASATVVRADSLRELASRVAAEKGRTSPRLEVGEMPTPDLRVRVPSGDWETIWRNLFDNATAAAREENRSVRMAISVVRGRDPVTGEGCARIRLSDDAPGTLEPETVRGDSAERGWGVVANLVRRNSGKVVVEPSLESPWRKTIVLEFPAVEET